VDDSTERVAPRPAPRRRSRPSPGEQDRAQAADGRAPRAAARQRDAGTDADSGPARRSGTDAGSGPARRSDAGSEKARGAESGADVEGGPRSGEAERLRADRIDETLTRLTAAHAGLDLDEIDRHGDEPDDAEAHDPGTDDDAADEHPTTPLAVRVGRITAAALALLLVLVAGTGWVGRTRLDGALHRVAAVDVPADGVLDAAAQTGDENVLVLATDSGRSAESTTRADTAVVVHTDARGGRTVAVTLPPDLEITRPPCERWDAAAVAYSGQTVPAEPRTAFDSAYAVGGPRCATRAAQQVTGLAITRFVAVDLAATSALVESVGGVDVCVERPVLDAVVGPVLPTAGTSSLGSARARDLVRATDVRDDPAPAAGLVQRQQRVLAAVLARALSLDRLLVPGRVGRLLPALSTAVVSTGTGVHDLLTVSRTLAHADPATLVAVPTEPAANSRGNRVLRAADAAALFAAVRTEAPLPAADPTAGSTAVTPADVTADVLNASGQDGKAAQVAGTLSDLGFRTGEVRNAAQPALDTVVRFSPDRAEQAQLLATAVPSASAVPDPGTSGVLELVLGRSFDGSVRAAVAPDAVAPAPAAPTARCG
jgi:LCP family protein required for cell wall assembly